MKWMIVASLIIAVFLASTYGQQQLDGTCASIGRSTSCCPRGTDCQAADGACMCDDACFVTNECCLDIGCSKTPRTCADVGIYQCCTDTAPGACEVQDMSAQPPYYCSCNVSCHTRGDCCSDASTFCVKVPPIPQNCAEAGTNVGCCQWSSTSSCYVAGGNCYCDSYCYVFGDCCSDVSPNCNANSQPWRSQQSRQQSVLEQELMASQVQNYYRERGANAANDNSGYTHHRMALAARTQRVRGNTNTASYREFRRGRARVAEHRPPIPPPYGY